MKSIKYKKSFSTLPWRLLKRYLANCSIHGVKYLVQDDCHWSERLFWLICCGLSWWGCSVMVSGVLTEYWNRQVATTIETNHLQWQATLPSLHFCTQEVPESKNYTSTQWPKGKNMFRLMDINMWGYIPGVLKPHDSNTLKKYADLGVMKCELMFERCIWNDKELDCCEIILPMWTPVGHCLVFNSVHTTNRDDGSRFKRKSTDSGVFTILIKSGSYFHLAKKHMTLYVLDRFDLPSILSSSEKKVLSKWISSEMQLDISDVPTYNEHGVRKISIEKRHCRFVDETEGLEIYKSYSYDACLAEDMMRRMLKYCGCVTHIIPRNAETPVCNYTGLSCISDYSLDLTNSDNVSCAADCGETTFEFFANFLQEKPTPIIHVNLLSGPTIRYRRYIVHSKLDLVVAVGSAVGLFIGASILSLVEIPYWFIVRGIDDEDDDDNARHN